MSLPSFAITSVQLTYATTPGPNEECDEDAGADDDDDEAEAEEVDNALEKGIYTLRCMLLKRASDNTVQ